MRGGLLTATVFLLAAIAISGVLPLWLDEIIQLRETRNTTPAQLLASLPRQPGAAPLGYMVQQTMLQATGYSIRRARVPGALFMAGSILLVAVLGAELGLATPWFAAAVFALFPFTLRYGTESRIYSQALFFSILATILFVRLMKTPRRLNVVLYCLALMAAIYTQPYAVFVGPAHVAWALFQDRKSAARAAFAVAVATATFLPWYLAARAIWSSGITGAGLHFVLSPKTPLMLFREVAGAGYWGSGLLLILCILALARPTRSFSLLLSLLIAIPIVLAITADAVSGYFVATRQIIWVLPSLAIFAALAIERTPRIALPLVALFAAISLWQSFHYFTQPRENWEIAANTIADELKQAPCLIVVPPEQQLSYAYFRHELAHTQCPAPKTVLAITPYATAAQREAAVAALTAQGYTRQSGTESGKSQVSLFTR